MLRKRKILGMTNLKQIAERTVLEATVKRTASAFMWRPPFALVFDSQHPQAIKRCARLQNTYFRYRWREGLLIRIMCATGPHAQSGTKPSVPAASRGAESVQHTNMRQYVGKCIVLLLGWSLRVNHRSLVFPHAGLAGVYIARAPSGP